ncbi:MAG: DUF2851 family protein [Bacteroidales bacterium]
MKEDFIHFLWRFRLLDPGPMHTTQGETLQILSPGSWNKHSGPDFSAARVRIGETLWVGNVEMHLKSSDWYRHNHQHDEAYHNIILHVVMEHDCEIEDSMGNPIPVLEISSCFDPALASKYIKIMESRSWIPCAAFIDQTQPVILMNWLSRLQIERLERKSEEILEFFHYFNQSWEQTFYYFLARNFGFKVNASPFGLLAQKTPYLILGKHKNDLTQLEALLMGQAGMLEETFSDAYPNLLRREYIFLRKKYQLSPMEKSLWKTSKLRPPNFPTLRLAQFARLIHQSSGLFSRLVECASVDEIYLLFDLQCSPYWDTHYTFDKPSGSRIKKLGHDAIDNIIINTLVPMKFVYGNHSLKPEQKDQAFAMLSTLDAEDNAVIRNWKKLGITPANAAESQALLELKKFYCTPKKCLNCAVGLNLIRNG